MKTYSFTDTQVTVQGETEYITSLRFNEPVHARLASLLAMDAHYRAKLEESGVNLAEVNYTFLSISSDMCGCSVKYKHVLDVPLTDVLCEHGNCLLRWTDDKD